MSQENRDMIRRWFDEVWNKGNADAIDEMFDEQGIAHGLSAETGAPMVGPAAFREFHAKFREAFPDIHVEIDDVVAEGDKVAARCTVTGNHLGDSLGLPATNNPVEFEGMAIVRVKDGKIVEGWNTFDFTKLYRQIGRI